MKKSNGFIGAWRVSEYVYNPDGRFAGIVHQRRELRQLDNGRLQVIQHCKPDTALNNHPMGQFKGEHLFELEVDGRVRRYLGPAVIGSGLPWGEGAMTGRGLWPHFGHNFTSFAVLAHENRQLTGGKFFNATEMIANIAGVAVPETSETKNQWPTLASENSPAAIAAEWHGLIRTILPTGELLNEQTLERCYQNNGCQETVDAQITARINVQSYADYEKVCGEWHGQQINGLSKRFGPLSESEIIPNPSQIIETMELVDSDAGYLIGLRRWLRDHQLEKVEVIRLRPHQSQ